MSNDNAVPTSTPRLDTLFAVFAATAEPAARWIYEGWCAHIRCARHANHVANSWAKHREDFGPLYGHVEALTVARILDAGVPAEEISALLNARIRARIRAEEKALTAHAA